MRPPLCSAGHVTPSAVRDPPLSYRSWPPVAPTDPPRCTRAPQNRSSPRTRHLHPLQRRAFRATRRSRTPPRDTRAPLASVLPAELTALARHRLPGARFAAATTLLPALSRGTRHRRRLSRRESPGQVNDSRCSLGHVTTTLETKRLSYRRGSARDPTRRSSDTCGSATRCRSRTAATPSRPRASPATARRPLRWLRTRRPLK